MHNVNIMNIMKMSVPRETNRKLSLLSLNTFSKMKWCYITHIMCCFFYGRGSA